MLRYLNFNLWYYLKPPWDSGISPPELLDFIANHPAGSAIDLGCGTGTNVITLAQHGWQVTGVDFAPRAIQLAKRKAQKTNLKINVRVDDVTRLNQITGPFDLALDIGCFHSIGDRPVYLTTLHRILQNSGSWLMYGFFKSELQKSGPGLSEPDLDLIQSMGFQQISRHDGFDKRERPSAWFLFKKSGNQP
jgi:cyclopropane fatty-acyl-phospholipid synthase-like methyltransferase